uniref:Phospholipid-transporting ATPase n=6 Tax=Parascaris univalens TaxID=6257 RepID=A0A915AWL6_PARUN
MRPHLSVSILSMIITYSGLIPISLLVTLEMISLFQAYFIRQDLELYDENNDTRAEVRSSNLNSQLGQVRYVVTDKTGTLTQNKMKFKVCTIGGVKYGDTNAEEFDSSMLLSDMESNSSHNAVEIREFLSLLAICHTVVPEKSKDGSLVYHASSPDEAALVICARQSRFFFHTRTPFCVYISAMGKEEKYEVLNVLEFTSTRRRMGVIVKSPNNKIKLYIKGADSVILPRLSADVDHKLIETTTAHLVDFANCGYRTLCMAVSELTDKEYMEWEPGYYRASIALDSREMLIEQQAEKIERNLRLLGATGIEDKLQEGVKATIANLSLGGMNIWVLTGDKLETAQNIGLSCGLIQPDMPTLVISEGSPEKTRDRLRSYISDICSSHCAIKIALIVSGQSLGYLLKDMMDIEFFFLASRCSCVICCRCSPMQKAAVVKLIQNYCDGATLAVGDGANDVAMIQAADVGVGICGEEGMQASLAADYSISQFRFLGRLLFVHGAISYHRTTKTILYFFYKTMCETIILFLYSNWSLSSETAVFDSWSIVFYNMFFSSWPPLAVGIWDRLFSFGIMEQYPGLYVLSQRGQTFNLKLFFLWIADGVLHAFVIFFVVYYTFEQGVVWSHGREANMRCFGTAMNIALVLTVNIKAAIEMDSHTIMSVVAIGGSLVMMFIYLFSYCLTSPSKPLVVVDPEMADIVLDILNSPAILLSIILSSVVAISIDVLFKVLQRLLYRNVKDEVLSKEFASGRKFDVLSDSFFKMRDFMVRTSESALSLVNHPQKSHGYAFSQDEGATVPQSDLVRIYDSRRPKQAGSPMEGERSYRYPDISLKSPKSPFQEHFWEEDRSFKSDNRSTTPPSSSEDESP